MRLVATALFLVMIFVWTFFMFRGSRRWPTEWTARYDRAMSQRYYNLYIMLAATVSAIACAVAGEWFMTAESLVLLACAAYFHRISRARLARLERIANAITN